MTRQEENWTLLRILKWCTSFFKEKGIDSARRDAEVLLGYTLNLSRIEIYTQFDRPLSKEERDDIRAVVKRRAQREPVAYITGTKEFWSLELKVTPDVLIPRPETEHLVETAKELLETQKITAPTVIDVGTGSGAVLLALAKEFPEGHFIGIEISEPAAEVARKNASALGLDDRIEIRRGSWLQPVIELKGEIDLIVSNPPYIPEAELDTLPPEVARYEPHKALYGGPDGLEPYRILVKEAAELLRETGYLVCEIHSDLGPETSAIFETAFYDISLRSDLAGLDRVLFGRPCPFG